MNLRRLFTGAGVIVAGAAVGNRLLARRADALENPLPGVERTYRWRGMDVPYTVAGDPDDPDVLLVHSINAAASRHEFASVFDRLADSYRVHAVDLPGFGGADRPPLHYSPTIYAEFLGEFASDVTDRPVVVASSLSGAYAAAAASPTDEADAPFERLVLVCPTDDTGSERPWLRTLFRTPLVGTALFNLLTSKPAIRYFLSREGYYDDENIDEDEVDFAWRSAHQPGARFAPAAFVAAELDPDASLETTLGSLEIPVTLVWGRDATLVPLRDGRTLAEAADLDLVVVDYATQLPHAERPAQFAEYLEAELVEAGSE